MSYLYYFCINGPYFLKKYLPLLHNSHHIMPNLQHISNLKILQILSQDDEALANNFISENLAIARMIPINLISSSLVGKPFISDEMRVMMVKQGHVELNVNLVGQRVEKNNMIFLGANGILEILRFSNDIQAIGMALSDDLFSMAVGNQMPKSLDGHLRNFHLALTQHEADYIDRLHSLLNANMKQEPHSAQVTLRLVSALLWQIDHLYSKQEQQQVHNQSREQQVFAAFMQLVSQHAPQHHDIEFYADKLFLSPRYMGNLIKAASGKTAKQWIDDTIATRIKIELQHSNRQIQLIADEMNFANTSFFTKFFKRMTGVTPHEYRKRNTPPPLSI